MQLHTTLAALKAAEACAPRYRHLCRKLGGLRKYGRDTPVTYLRILELNGLEDCIWALFHGRAAAILLGQMWALDCAERVQHLSVAAQVCNGVTRLYLHGEATREEVSAAADAARAAARAAWAARAASWAAARDAWAARAAARAAWAAADAARDAWAAARAAARAAWAAEEAWQLEHLKEMLTIPEGASHADNI